ncbi:Glutamate racemase [Paraburkholderia domus]|jgi:aspartate racemase|uniref:Glutamate racemase n=1 Tax=Paraburkholderia domus TaxID=2793075 RepID=A0A9N8N1T5_9BURK|nr:amino acid racemase [Paraburkholderia domus]MBK5054359.1 aspartate/glutamate racemase family protein [Burkholderia sp. R-70006]MBK5064229.1 aspartate/glutamate racemase family protein [Burkholderia sp. R-70199]MBK5086812.1 aspartate/glutamate racemase family protein [Burkholderia sp. R-69927]MBK5121535.1 aspartate/glutamate racemase family protein [Burkholderia sp. R-69980]MBK5166678.1 aspartate/glutamate racemase family protein [Burkholderia sp. R-70211]MBK5186022.1 aspartate/glutamate ra
MYRHRSLGVVTGASPLAGVDVLSRMTTSWRRSGAAKPFDFVLEQQSWQGPVSPGAASVPFKIHVFDTIRAFEKRGVDAIVLPCFLSHTFIDELSANVALPIANLMAALLAHVRQAFPSVRRVGVLTSDAIRGNGLFERYFDSAQFDVLHPRNEAGVDRVTSAVYGDEGIKSGHLYGRPVALLRAACADLIGQGAEIILPGLAEIGMVARALGTLEVPFVDTSLVYARYVAAAQYSQPERRFKVGVLGGVGPAATVDFMAKLVRNTPAARDQDHIKVMVEQNPQIPDRTEALLGNGDDPTLALYAACKTLEEGGADLIAIPCNTAHAFVERIQPSLTIPIVNMLTCTADYLREAFPSVREVGVLATSGTLASGVYEKALEACGLVQVAPGDSAQARLMNGIYGPCGVKAGYTSGECYDDVAAAVDDLLAQGVQVIVLGCTELPLLLRGTTLARPGLPVVRLVDPTDVLARRCVAYALGGREAAYVFGAGSECGRAFSARASAS